jgi:hypothetical protein
LLRKTNQIAPQLSKILFWISLANPKNHANYIFTNLIVRTTMPFFGSGLFPGINLLEFANNFVIFRPSSWMQYASLLT